MFTMCSTRNGGWAATITPPAQSHFWAEHARCEDVTLAKGQVPGVISGKLHRGLFVFIAIEEPEGLENDRILHTSPDLILKAARAWLLVMPVINKEIKA